MPLKTDKMRTYQRWRRQQRRQAGLKQVTVEVPKETAAEIRELAAAARNDPTSLNANRERDRQRARRAIAAGRAWRRQAEVQQERNQQLVQRIFQSGWRAAVARWLLGLR